MIDMFEGCCFSKEELLSLRSRTIAAMLAEDGLVVRCFFDSILKGLNGLLTVRCIECARSYDGGTCI